jgi:hypothetical protein
MSEAVAAVPFVCPGCSVTLDVVSQGRVQCPRCRWVGDVYSFKPKLLQIEEAVAALPEDATCLHHPRKKAVAVCAGTGDYVCALCAIELNGQTYSAEYLNGAGKTLAGKAFERNLPRPDSQILFYMLLCFVPYINAIFLAFAFVWIPHAIYLFTKLIRLRRENPVLRRVVGQGRLIWIAILISLFGVGWIAMAIGIAVLIVSKNR